MKKILLLFAVALCGMSTSCSDDEWSNNNAAMEHIYYYGLCNEKYPNGNEKKYDVRQGETVAVPTQFFSSFTRPYSPVVYYYTDGMADKSKTQLIRGTDYIVVDENGDEITPDENGAFTMTWPNAKAGTQNVYIKALNGQTGSMRVLTFDPKKEDELDNMDVESTVIVRTNEYEVRAFTENYYITVNIK